jgi:hypothetical protein
LNFRFCPRAGQNPGAVAKKLTLVFSVIAPGGSRQWAGGTLHGKYK